MKELEKQSLTELRKNLDAGEFSAQELVENSLKIIEEKNSLNAFISLQAEEALQKAQKADQEIKAGNSKLLTGIPVAIKDVILTKGHQTTAGSKILKGFIPPYSATVVNKLQSQGAISIGKTNLDEFAMGSSNENSAYGVCRNPHDPERVPGGSSGGSIVAVASGMAPAALGTDTGGSIRQPSSLCGTVGLKPTYGRVSRYGVVAYASSLDQVGPVTTNVRDSALMLNVLSGKDEYDATSADLKVPDFTADLGKDIKGLKVGLPKEFFIEGLNSEVKAAVDTACKQLESLGAEIVEVSLPHSGYAIPCYYIVATAEASSNLSRYDGIRYGHRAENTADLFDLYCKSRFEGFGTEVKRRILIGTYVLSSGYYDAYYLKAQKVRRLIKEDFEKAYEKCDLIVGPVAPTTAFKIGEKTDDPVQMYLNDIYTITVNLAGLPAMSIPCGKDSQNLPIGLHIIAPAWQEANMLKAAYAYEQSTNFNQ